MKLWKHTWWSYLCNIHFTLPIAFGLGLFESCSESSSSTSSSSQSRNYENISELFHQISNRCRIVTYLKWTLPLASKPCNQLRVQRRAWSFFGRRRLLYLLNTWPPMLKADSEATVVIGILNKSLAINARMGNLLDWSFHHSKTSRFLYKATSSSGISK